MYDLVIHRFWVFQYDIGSMKIVDDMIIYQIRKLYWNEIICLDLLHNSDSTISLKCGLYELYELR